MPEQSGDFTGRTAVITGAGTGLGRGFALDMVDRGAETIGLIGRRKELLDEVAAEVSAGGARPVVLPLDIRDAGAVESAMDAMIRSAGRIDVLINNAAGNFLVHAEDLTPNGFDAVVRIVLYGSVHCSLAAGRRMIAQGSGKILSIIASYAWMGGPGTLHSATAKAGVLAMTRTLAVEWAPHGVQVNSLCPGFVDTEQSRTVLWPTEPGRQRLRDRIPAGRFGTVEEVVGAGLFLCSPAADYVTGENLTIDGGEWLNKGAFDVPEKARSDG